MVVRAILTISMMLIASMSYSLTQQSRVVGGVDTSKSQWPWMALLGTTYLDRVATLNFNGVDYPARTIENSGSTSTISAELIDCGASGNACEADVSGKICLIERGVSTFAEKSKNCAAAGGVAAIIYNNKKDIYSGTMVNDHQYVPTIAISQKDGQSLQQITNTGIAVELTVAAETSSVIYAYCGGSYLGNGWILTAAHCVYDSSPSQIGAAVGVYDLRTDASLMGAVSQIIVHPQFNIDTLDYDVALVGLQQLPSALATVGLSTPENTSSLESLRSEVTVLGWGGRTPYAQASNDYTSDFPNILQQANVFLAPCSDYYDTAAEGITDRMLCATVSDGGKDACHGDSGGPLVVYGSDGQWQQQGIVSWGYGCAQAGLSGVYTRVGAVREWILENTNMSQSSGSGGAFSFYGLIALLMIKLIIGLLLSRRRQQQRSGFPPQA